MPTDLKDLLAIMLFAGLIGMELDEADPDPGGRPLDLVASALYLSGDTPWRRAHVARRYDGRSNGVAQTTQVQAIRQPVA